ncbi:conserved hypothetical protein [Talaromyces stipitatus ATCC 10500]|uniref:DDE-1 domain-containing protein n=1 Tax=Talaromyces stipitatus (strain ATCC 10500 / CBS 375.48 / QM 6759 / NRRL 1006) TaxID=441959 RepID=B8MVA8_TALSN|nr:uncharacterized protein TSTA_008600 [Talaromyces stipitatus ATCC 10500]EED11564.1 conserved hypothetical protein [Talaromyces stipitatus ATCC 10500]
MRTVCTYAPHSLPWSMIPPRHSLVREMVNYLLSQHGNQQVYNLVKRRPEIESKFSRKYNYEGAKCEDPKMIQEYFDRVREVTLEYGILPEDIYNFDETGFAMGLCATAKVVTGSDRYARPKLLQPVNREWATAIEQLIRLDGPCFHSNTPTKSIK